MKLQFFIHALTGGGAERVMATLMNSFVELGHQVQVVYTEGLIEPVYELDKRIEQVYLAQNGPKVTSSIINKIRRRFWKYPAIRKAAKSYNADAAVSFVKVHNNDVLFALLGTGIPVVVGDHTNVDRKYKWLTTTLSNILYPHAGAITMLTKRDYNLWKDKYKHVYYMPNPCETPLVAKDANRNKVVLAAGRVNQWDIKGFDNLMRAWNLIKDEFPGWKCQIAGAFDEKGLNGLRNVVSAEEFNSVELLGFRSDIHDLMATSEVFCLSSRIEGMPMTLLEALNMNCACVSADCITGPAEMIADGETGLLAKDDDYRDLANKLRLVLNNESLRHSFQSKARESVQRFSSANIVKMWTEMLNEVIINK